MSSSVIPGPHTSHKIFHVLYSFVCGWMQITTCRPQESQQTAELTNRKSLGPQMTAESILRWREPLAEAQSWRSGPVDHYETYSFVTSPLWVSVSLFVQAGGRIECCQLLQGFHSEMLCSLREGRQRKDLEDSFTLPWVLVGVPFICLFVFIYFCSTRHKTQGLFNELQPNLLKILILRQDLAAKLLKLPIPSFCVFCFRCWAPASELSRIGTAPTSGPPDAASQCAGIISILHHVLLLPLFFWGCLLGPKWHLH